MGIIRNLKNGNKEESKNQIKRFFRKRAKSFLSFGIVAVIFLIFVLGIFDLGIEIASGENNPKLIYETLGIEDVSELIEIKEDGNGGYYLDFIDGIDDKLREIVNKANKGDYHNLPTDINFLKRILKAEVYTQFPDLGGTVPDGSDGFQGAVKIRRVTPNKDIGEMKNTGRGETSNLEQGTVDEPVSVEDRNDQNKIDSWQSGQRLRIVSVEAYIYEDKYDAGYWEPIMVEGSTTQEMKLKKNDIVTYQGEYKIDNNALTGQQTIYLKVKTEDAIEGYVKSSTVNALLENSTQGQVILNDENNETRLATTSRANDSREEIGVEGEEYVVAIAAGRNSGNDTGIVNEEKGLKEEELTIEVTERVEELLNKYSNIKVVQTGSTSRNPDGVEPEDRAERARKANPDLCIQIYFGDGDEVGVETIYKEGDQVSQQLANILAENISSSMGLSNLSAGEDTVKCVDAEGNATSLNIIENSVVAGFPSVVAIGGNLNKDPDASVIANDGVEKYAQGIVNSIDEYFKADHTGLEATEVSDITYTDSVESRIINMRYVSQETMQGYVDNGNIEEAIKCYTLDDERNVVIASWSMSEDGSIEVKTNNSMSLKTALEKYVMPYEYLLYFYIDTDYEDFVDDLANEVMNSEIVVAVQDEVRTTHTIETTEQMTDATIEQFDVDWHVTNSREFTTETVSTKVNITYVSTWCVKTYQENSYSEAVLNLGKEEEKVIEVPGKVTETSSTTKGADNVVVDNAEGVYTHQKVDENGNLVFDENGNPVYIDETYYYDILEHLITDTHTISNTYEKGEYKTEGRENVFVKLYNDHDMISKVRTSDYLFTIIENNERTANLLDLTKYLIYKATNVPWGVLTFDYEGEYSLEEFNTVSGGGGGQIPLYTPVLSREDFIAAMEAYSYNSSYDSNFKPNAALIYDTSVANGVNPELVVVTAQTEQAYRAGGGAYNYWGIAVYNGSSSGSGFSSFEEAIAGYASVVKSYETDGSYSSRISAIAEERASAGCNPLGYGQPGTLSGMQSLYSYLGKHEYGSAGAGGYYYMDPDRAGVTAIYATHQEFLDKCYNAGGEHAPGTETTVWEQGQYTAWQVQSKIDVWNDIFGAYGSLAGIGGTTTPATGDGYFQTYTSSTGRTYKEYKQYEGSYKHLYYAGGTIADSGCSITAIATVISGYEDNKTPASFSGPLANLSECLRSGGAECSGYEAADASRLTSGKPAVVSISGTLVTERGSKYYGGHYIAILDGRNGNEVYVSDPGANDANCGGWTDVQNIINIVNRGVLYVSN